MRAAVFLFMLVLSSLMVVPAFAGFKDGNDLYKDCSATEMQYFSRGICLGFVMGVFDTAEKHELSGYRFCPPAKLTAGQMQDVVIKYLANNPAKRHMLAYALVVHAAVEAFPCKGSSLEGGNNSNPFR